MRLVFEEGEFVEDDGAGVDDEIEKEFMVMFDKFEGLDVFSDDSDDEVSDED